MKISVTIKDPDTLRDAVEDAVKAEVDKLGMERDEAGMLIEHRTEKLMDAMKKWWEYSEYLNVEFDMDAMTANVLERQ